MTTSATARESDSKDFVPDLHLLGIRDVIYKTAGIFQPDHKLHLLKVRCALRMKELGIGLLRDYFQHLTKPNGQAETTILLNEIMVGATGFFRSVPQLDALRKIIVPKLIAAKSAAANHTLKIWSAGCSTGEEAYTLAIILLEASSLLQGWTCSVLAMDLNENSVEHAKRGIYGENSTMNLPPLIRQKYFVKDAAGLSVGPQVRALVSIQHLNLLDGRHMSMIAKTDIIFCRNVLIHFDMASKARVVEHFHNSLSPAGVLFLGHAESLFGVTNRFSLLHMPFATAYEKAKTQLPKRPLL